MVIQTAYLISMQDLPTPELPIIKIFKW